MKKLIGTVAVAALIASAAFAEISMGAWLRVLAAPVAYDGDGIVSGMTNSWGWGARVARVDINGVSEDEKVGFSMGVFNDAYKGLSVGDNYVIWAKPWDFLKVSFGKWDYTAFRGDLCYGSWNWIRPNNWIFNDEGLTFDQIGNQNGIQLEITPVEGLLAMWNLPLPGAWKEDDKCSHEWVLDNGKFTPVKDMLRYSDAGVKYTIGSIGTIKAGWEGQKASYDDDNDKNKYGDVNVAFDLTAVDKLYVTVGAKIGIANSDYKDNKDNDFELLKVALGANYQILDNLKVSASFGLRTFQNKYTAIDITHKPDFQFGVGVDVGLTDSLSLTADFRGVLYGDREVGNITTDGKNQFSFLVGVQYNMSSNGYIGIGFQGTTNGCGFPGSFDAYKEKDNEPSNKFCFAVPIAISCWF